MAEEAAAKHLNYQAWLGTGSTGGAEVGIVGKQDGIVAPIHPKTVTQLS